MSDWLITAPPIASQTDLRLRPSTNPNFAEALDTWQELVGDFEVDPEHGDDETALEQAYRLWAAWVSIDRDRIWLRDGAEARHVLTGTTGTVDYFMGMQRWGPVLRMDVPLSVELAADGYAGLAALHRHAGRRVVVCGSSPDDGSPDLAEVVHGMLAETGGRVFVKVNRAKYLIERFELDVNFSLEEVRTALAQTDLTGAMMHLEGRNDAFLVQPSVPMFNEYRLFIVDGVPVTGAGAIEEFTPAESAGEAFDPRLRSVRSTASEPVNDTATRDLLVDFGSEVAREMLAERPTLTHYTLDVAQGADGSPLVVELNGILNSRLYASRPELVVCALEEMVERS